MGATGSNTMMALSSFMGGAMDLAGSFANSSAEADQGAWQQQQFEFNKEMAEMQARDAKRRGKTDARKVRKAGKRIIGSQRAALAAQGIELDSGSALQVQEDTAYLSEMDALTIRNNASREAFGYKMQALDYSGRGQMARFAADAKARSTLMTGGLGFAGSLMAGAMHIKKNYPKKKEV